MLRSILKAIFGGKGEEPKHVELSYPKYCDELRRVLESGNPYTLKELQDKLKKKKGTIYHELSVLRGGGLVIKKQYDKSISANKYRIVR
jgi:DNA-binding transcriptional ArsR family regulator|tara:strand:+ start:631 stop:897 length:267 start_codon:yes stop_codon:yes gene_type:complete